MRLTLDGDRFSGEVVAVGRGGSRAATASAAAVAGWPSSSVSARRSAVADGAERVGDDAGGVELGDLVVGQAGDRAGPGGCRRRSTARGG